MLEPCAWKKFNSCIALIFRTYIWIYLIILWRGHRLVAAACLCRCLHGGAAATAACFLLACFLLAACLLLAVACCCLLAFLPTCLPACLLACLHRQNQPCFPLAVEWKVLLQLEIAGWIGQQTSWELSTTLMHIAAIDLVAGNKGPVYICVCVFLFMYLFIFICLYLDLYLYWYF